MAEKIDRLKHDEEVRGYLIESLKGLFIMRFEKFVKKCVWNQRHLKNFAQYAEARESYLMRYETIIKNVDSGKLSQAEVDHLETVCHEIKEMQRSVDDEIQASEELTRTIADRKENEEKQLHQQQQQQAQQQRQQSIRSNVDTTNGSDPITATAIPNTNSFVSCSERVAHYHRIIQFYEEYAESVQPLQIDIQMKKFRFECIKCINILTNSISSASPTHLQDKYDRFAQILSGNCVEIGGTSVTPKQHPLGIRFVNLLVAKMFVVSLSIIQ